MDEAKKTPKIRFKNYNKEWADCKLSTVFKEYNVRTQFENQYPVLSSTMSGIYFQDEYFNQNVSTISNIGYKIVPKGYMTYRSMSDNNIFHFNIQNITGKGIVSPAYPVFNCNDGFNSKFVITYMNKNVNFKKQLLYRKEGGTRYALPYSKLKEMTIISCDIEEQRKIARMIETIDNIINLNQKKCEKLINARKFLLEKMFVKDNNKVPELRFKDFHEQWIDDKLENNCGIYLGLTYTPEYVPNGIAFLSSKDISNDYLDLSELKYISHKEFNRVSSNAKPIKGDVLFTRVGSNLGHPVVIEENMDLCIFVSLGYLRANNGINNYYLRNWMNSLTFKKQLIEKTGGGAKVNINTGWLKDFEFSYPEKIEEQEKIGDYFSKFDNLITLYQKKCEKLINIRKALLEKIYI